MWRMSVGWAVGRLLWVGGAVLAGVAFDVQAAEREPAAVGQTPISADAPPERQFDFWLGSWKVNNRRFGTDGKWQDKGEARALIEPILGERAIVEQWSGVVGGGELKGFSLRAYDSKRKKWIIILNWPGKRSQGFSTMEGTFRHARGEFFPPGAIEKGSRNLTRYTFSDPLPDSCRWDQATSSDGGGNWRTTWIMEFTRAKGRRADKRSVRKINTPPRRPDCSARESRQFDFLIGEWSGSGRSRTKGSAWADTNATLRATSMIDGCGLMTFLIINQPRGEPVETFVAGSYNENAGHWACRSIASDTGRLQSATGYFEGGAATFIQRDSLGRARAKTEWSQVSEDRFHWQRARSTNNGKTWTHDAEFEFTRKR